MLHVKYNTLRVSDNDRRSPILTTGRSKSLDKKILIIDQCMKWSNTVFVVVICHRRRRLSSTKQRRRHLRSLVANVGDRYRQPRRSQRHPTHSIATIIRGNRRRVLYFAASIAAAWDNSGLVVTKLRVTSFENTNQASAFSRRVSSLALFLVMLPSFSFML